MSRPPVLSGELPEGGAIELLRQLEQKRITGTLRFESEVVSGALDLYGGEIAAEQEPRDDGRDPVDVLLELERGRYEIHQRLPPLSVARGDDYTKRGSLAVHVAADLMTYCEQAGLSGTLELRHEEHRAEAVYDAGELLAIELDGRGEADLSQVFAWERGSFRVQLDPEAPARFREEEAPTLERPAAPKREDTRQFLRVVEMALADVVQESERARSPTRSSPPLPPPPKARPRPPAIPAPSERRTAEQTVRLIYLGGEPPEVLDDPSTRHVAKGEAELALTEARPERRRAAIPEPRAMADEENDVDATPSASGPEPAASGGEEKTAAETAPQATSSTAPVRPLAVVGGALAWCAAFVVVALLILAVLARLPAVQ